ncbi:MAG: Non-specific serine/threonine protein kinase [Hydrocarboniphaga sp.]|uniref:DEAD/DEAH box helicase n=1 Tax=Hydrocarboniphaga sp. TaxID=2033016 RepID=UPI00262747E5|nr:DEAD/DEAH box helicase [Hydrocarboniphaga sp.]MDB5970957.1 Non-specific serine/threonine protein kinase [Hydrocarboniphaga sp.]
MSTSSPKSKKSHATRKRKGKPAEPRLSRQRQPAELAVEDWQRALRRQFGREQSFGLKNIGSERVFSEYAVSNPGSGGSYRVAIRGTASGQNFCSCADFATNDLGSCKHVEFVLARIEAGRGGKAALKRAYSTPHAELYLDYSGQRSLRFRTGTAAPKAVAEQAAHLFGSDGRLQPERFDELEAFLGAAAKAGLEVRCHDDALAFVAQARDSRWRRRALDEAYPKGARSAALKNLLKVPLYPYQAEGALFAARAGRALLGDEMGLGKTIQAIAAAELFARHFGATRVLVVCPTSLKHQWQREIARFAGRDAQVIQGLRTQRELQYRQETFCKITNYDTLARDLDLIQAWAPDVVIADEAQRIKNWNTRAAVALKRIDSPYAVVLTGTPLENRLEELISIVQFVDRHRLGPTWRLLHEHQRRDEAGRVIGYQGLDRIGATLAPILLRRRKAEVLEQLPARIDNTLFVAMTPQQRIHHDENGETVARIISRWRKTGYLSDADQRRLTCSLQNMRMSCNSTYLLDGVTDHGSKVDELETVLAELLEQPDAKAVIFSQWLRTHELIARRLKTRGWEHVLFHGGVPGEKRGALVDRFIGDPACRVFLSTDAGGVGLNLQHAAATVINMDLPWNPAVLEQRIGRVHRLGQTRSVQVVNFVAQGTIEEGMLSVLAFKKSLFAGVLDGGGADVFLNGTRLSSFMKSVEAVTGAIGEAEHQTPYEAGDGAESGLPLATPASETKLAPAAVAMPESSSLETGPASIEASVGAPAPPATADPFSALLDAGLSLLESVAAVRRGDDVTSPWIATDPQTGKSFLKLPLPEPAMLGRLAAVLAKLGS